MTSWINEFSTFQRSASHLVKSPDPTSPREILKAIRAGVVWVWGQGVWSVSGSQCGMDYNNLSIEVKSQVEVQTRTWVERWKVYTGENSRV